MEKEINEVRIKKSELNARDFFDFEKLAAPQAGCVPYTYEEELEELVVSYDMTGLKPVKEIKTESVDNQYQLLINFARIEPLAKAYQISFAADNLFYDDNHLLYVKAKDLYPKGVKGEDADFLEVYKAYIGGILGKRYSVKQLLESGTSLLKKEAFFKAYSEAESVTALTAQLKEKREGYLKKIKATTVSVSRTGNYVKTALAFLSTILLLAAVGLIVYGMVIVIPGQEKIISANESFIAKDYVSCIDSLREVEPEDMSAQTKYILASSYAYSESLKQEEIESIVTKLSVSSNEKELDYWIHLGRLEASEAQDLAKALSDDKLLMYAYMKELDQLESNTKVSGEEKASRISELENNITQLGEKYESTEVSEEAE